MSDPSALAARATEHGVKTVRFTFCDTAGVIRCKGTHVRQFERKLTEGVSLSRAQMAMTMLDELVHVDHMQPVGEIRLMPDPETFVVLPWAPGTASVLCQQVSHTEQGWEACPRRILKRAIERLRDRGIVARAAFETEFYVVDPDPDAAVGYRRRAKNPVYSTIGHDAYAELMDRITDALEAQGIEVEQAINEYGPGQLEFSVAARDPVGAADDFIRIRDTVRALTAEQGWAASFAPKPFPDEIGSGEHIHLSLWNDEGESLLQDPDSAGRLSRIGLGTVAGLLEHLPALIGLTAPSFNSYRRFEAGMWASTMTSWGYDNREAAVRVASPFTGREAASFNVELKPADATGNPYLALTGILLAALDGISRELVPPEPSVTDPARLSEQERERYGLRDLPKTMTLALDELEQDEVLREGLGPELFDVYLAVRRHEDRRFRSEDEDFEFRRHFNVY